MTVWDADGDGPGRPKLYAAGTFASIGETPVNSVAAWDGLSWAPLGPIPGVRGSSGPGVIRALAVFDDDGEGPRPPALYAAGTFGTAGGGPAAGIARWDGAAWEPLGTGLSGHAHSLTVYDADGTGPAAPLLVAAGQFSNWGVNGSVAAWDGRAWAPLGVVGSSGPPSVAVLGPGGSGAPTPALMAAGVARGADGQFRFGLHRWDGTNWVILGPAPLPCALRARDPDGAGPLSEQLFAVGAFTSGPSGAMGMIGRWTGASWDTMVGGMTPAANQPAVGELIATGGGGAGVEAGRLLAVGAFTAAGGVPAPNLALWNGNAWAPFGGAPDDAVLSMATHDADGAGPEPAELFVGGSFTGIGGAYGRAERVARLGPAGFVLAGSGVPGPAGDDGGITGLFSVDQRAPRGLVALGAATWCQSPPPSWFGGAALWDGTSWSPLGSRFPAYASTSSCPSTVTPTCAAFFDPDGAGPAPDRLYVGGWFPGGIQYWNGADWTPVTLAGGAWLDLTSSSPLLRPGVSTMQVYDDDADGPRPPSLYVAGTFNQINRESYNFIARYDGAAFHPVVGLPSPGADGPVFELRVFDEDGDGPLRPALFAAGQFSRIGGVAAGRVARWDGTAWTSLGERTFVQSQGVPSYVSELEVFDEDGEGPARAALYVGGWFGGISGAPTLQVSNLARWTGSAWEAISAGGTNDAVADLHAHDDDGDGPLPAALYVAGRFSAVGETPSRWIARLGRAAPPAVSPANLTVPPGADAVFTVEGSGASAFRWLRNGEPLSDDGRVIGSGTARLTIATAAASDAGEYRVMLTEACGEVLSQAARLSVRCPADADGSGDVTVVDIFAFLGLWFGAEPRADFDASGGAPDLTDVFLFLGAWFAGC